MNLDIASIALLSRILGELALISIVYGSICRLGLNAICRQVAHGVLFGAAAIVTTMSPIAFSNGVQIDGHIMMLAYSAAFGGPVTYGIAVLALQAGDGPPFIVGLPHNAWGHRDDWLSLAPVRQTQARPKHAVAVGVGVDE
jgi:hypothetical protein